MPDDAQTNTVSEHARDVARQTVETGRRAEPWAEWLGRAGFAAVGVVYGLVGVLAAEAAIGRGGATTDPKGALEHVVYAPFGQALLAIITVGLAGYSLWRLVEALFDPEHKAGWWLRVSYFWIGAVYAGLAYSSARMVMHASPGKTSDQSTRDWTAKLLAHVWGEWLVIAAGLFMLGVAGAQLYQGISLSWFDRAKHEELSDSLRATLKWSGRLGFVSLGVVFSLIGVFLIHAALAHNPRDAEGLGGALASLARHPYGPWLLLVVAMGLILYSISMLLRARYERMTAT